MLLVSGGHTLLVHMEGHGRYRVLGSTIDDAAGEAFDKVARYLGLGYPGGPAIDRIAVRGRPRGDPVPPPDARRRHLDFSFSGLKTAVVNHVRKHPTSPTADVAASFQDAVVDVLVTKARPRRRTSARRACLGGGVAANSLLRTQLLDACEEDGLRCLLPSPAMCTDNAAMVASAAWYRWQADGPSPGHGGLPNLGLSGRLASNGDVPGRPGDRAAPRRPVSRAARREELGLRTRAVVEASAVADIGLRTLAASMVTASMVPLALSRRRLAGARRADFYGELAEAGDVTLVPAPDGPHEVRARRVRPLPLRGQQGTRRAAQLREPLRGRNPAMRAAYAAHGRNRIGAPSTGATPTTTAPAPRCASSTGSPPPPTG